MALKDKLRDKVDYENPESLVITYFEDTRDTFVFFIESLNGNFFDAEYRGLAYTNDEVSGVICFIELGNGKEFVSEIVTYDIY